jgi:23S rRNA (guanosine2251-2'-O)-methyltransferase
MKPSRPRHNRAPAASPAAVPKGEERIFGLHSVRAVMTRRAEDLRRMIVLEGQEPYLEDVLELARRAKVPVEHLPMSQFMRVGSFTEEERHQKHQGIFVFSKARRMYDESDLDRLSGARVVLALDQVSNPQNLAAILRNAAFFRVDAVILMKNRSAELTPTVLRVAVGGAEYVSLFRVTNLARTLELLKELGFWIYGLDERGEKTLAETRFGDKTVFVLGAEGQGLRQRTREFSDALVRIPGGQPGVESLNVAVAAAVALAQVCRG